MYHMKKKTNISYLSSLYLAYGFVGGEDREVFLVFVTRMM